MIGVGGGPDGRQQAVERLAPVLDALEPPLPLQQLDLALEDIHRVAEDRLQRVGAALLHQRVGILAGRHRGHPDPHLVAQQLVAGAEGGPEPGGVAVVAAG